MVGNFDQQPTRKSEIPQVLSRAIIVYRSRDDLFCTSTQASTKRPCAPSQLTTGWRVWFTEGRRTEEVFACWQNGKKCGNPTQPRAYLLSKPGHGVPPTRCVACGRSIALDLFDVVHNVLAREGDELVLRGESFAGKAESAVHILSVFESLRNPWRSFKCHGG